MTDVSNAALLQAYKDAIEANEDGIAELLKTVILEAMRDERAIVIGESRTTTEPPWNVTCGPDIVSLDGEKLDTVTVHTFHMGNDKEAALKPLEEAAEVFGAWQRLGETDWGDVERIANDGLLDFEGMLKLGCFADEIADCIQACVNLADRYNLDLQAAMERCEERNRERGRYE